MSETNGITVEGSQSKTKEKVPVDGEVKGGGEW